jgi:hypothetical protein
LETTDRVMIWVLTSTMRLRAITFLKERQLKPITKDEGEGRTNFLRRQHKQAFPLAKTRCVLELGLVDGCWSLCKSSSSSKAEEVDERGESYMSRSLAGGDLIILCWERRLWGGLADLTVSVVWEG